MKNDNAIDQWEPKSPIENRQSKINIVDIWAFGHPAGPLAVAT
jgi:hypothetical protein